MKLQINHLVEDTPWNKIGVRKTFIETDNITGWSKKYDCIIIEVEHRPTYTFNKYVISLDEAKRIEKAIVECRKVQKEKEELKKKELYGTPKTTYMSNYRVVLPR